MNDAGFTFKSADRNGFIPDNNLDLIGKYYSHPSRPGEIWLVCGFAWDSATDEWGILHSRTDKMKEYFHSSNFMTCFRTVSNFFLRMSET